MISFVFNVVVVIYLFIGVFLLGLKINFFKDFLMLSIFGNFFDNLDVFILLLFLVVMIILVCFLRVKLIYESLGLMYFLYIFMILLWFIIFGFVKFQIFVKLCLVIFSEIGSSLFKMVILLGIFIIFWYFMIFEMKFCGFCRLEEIGICICNVYILLNLFNRFLI